MNLPLHPALVHFPIALYFLELIILLTWVFRKDEMWRRFALFTFTTAFLFMTAALISGWNDAGGTKGLMGEVKEHFYGAVWVGVIQLARGSYWYIGKPRDNQGRVILLLSALFGYAAVIVTAYHGGEIVYHTH